MKKIFYVALCVLAIGLVSCNKKAETIQDLKVKYEGKTFENCKTFLPAYDEIMNVYFATIDKAYEGDENALNEIAEFEPFFTSLNEDTGKMEAECPEKFQEFQENMEKRMQEVFPKLIELAEKNLNPVEEEIIIEEDSIVNQEGDTLEIVEIEVAE